MQTESVYGNQFEPSKENIHPSCGKESQKQSSSQRPKIDSFVFNDN